VRRVILGIDLYPLSATKTVHSNLSKADHTRRSRQLPRTCSAVDCYCRRGTGPSDTVSRYRRHAIR